MCKIAYLWNQGHCWTLHKMFLSMFFFSQNVIDHVLSNTECPWACSVMQYVLITLLAVNSWACLLWILFNKVQKQHVQIIQPISTRGISLYSHPYTLYILNRLILRVLSKSPFYVTVHHFNCISQWCFRFFYVKLFFMCKIIECIFNSIYQRTFPSSEKHLWNKPNRLLLSLRKYWRLDFM